MTLANLLKFGYFSEELPPPFSTELFGKRLRKVQSIISALSQIEKKKLNETNYVRYSIPKVGIHRRLNGIPNPYHQFILSKEIYNNWPIIKKHYRSSPLSASFPEDDTSNKRAVIQFSKFEKFKEKCIEASFDTFFELKSDISKYFPSIYTHSIPWAVHTKSVAKARRRDRTLYGNILDECVRFAQSGQTIGIPIGTDTSRIIAEIIGCSIDSELVRQLKIEGVKIKGYRFVDDCHFFFYSQSDAEIGLKHFHKILSNYSLNINEEKTVIKKAPFLFENNWSHQLTSFKFRFNPKFQRFDLRNYFNLVVNLSKQYPNDSVTKYGIKIIKKLNIHKSNWELFESLILSLVISEGSVLPDLLAILLQNKSHISRKKLESTIESLLNQHVYKGNHFEISWTLWIAKTFKIKISKKIAEIILESRDIISILVLLDLRQSKLVPARLNLTDILLEFNQDGLTNEYWLLVYEASHKKWMSSSALSSIKFFEELSNNGVSFYDENKQIPYGKPNVITKKSQKQREKAVIKSIESISDY